MSRTQRLDEASVDVSVKDGQPSSVEHEGFQNVSKILDPSNSVPRDGNGGSKVRCEQREKALAEIRQLQL